MNSSLRISWSDAIPRFGRSALVFAVVLILGASCGKSNSTTTATDDPLSIVDVEEELRELPRPLHEFAAAVEGKQNYFEGYMKDFTDTIMRRKDLVDDRVAMWERSNEISIVWALGYSRADVKGIFDMITWDAWSTGWRPVRATAHWEIFLDKDDNIIGYMKNDRFRREDANSCE